MNNNSHPLRPAGGYVLICEGKEDIELLNGILSPFISNFSIFYADGKENVAKLRGILKPAISIMDRDFDYLPNDLENGSYQNPQLYWVRHDIEAYLIYPDWLLEAIQFIDKKVDYPLKYTPKALETIEPQIVEIAHNLIIDHAGRKTTYWLNQEINKINPQFSIDRQVIKGGAEFSSVNDWNRLFQSFEEKIANAPQKLSDTLVSIKIQDKFVEYHQVFADASQSLDTILRFFSGKRILKILSQKWQLQKIRGKDNSEESADTNNLIRNQLVKIAIAHANAIKSQNKRLSDDPRLGDFGRLASKITGKNDI